MKIPTLISKHKLFTIVQDQLHNDNFAAKYYRFLNWAEPSIKQVSKAANDKDQNTTAVSFFFLFSAPAILAARLSIACSSNF